MAVRVLVFHPSAQRRQRLQRLLETDPALQVVGGAGSPEHVAEMAARRLADVIVLVQPDAAADGIAGVRSLMRARPTPIVAVTAAPSPMADQQALALLEAGALAVLHDPGAAGHAGQPQALAKLLQTVKLMAEVKVVRRWVPDGARAAAPAPKTPPPRSAAPRPPPARLPAARPPEPRTARRVELVAIGASTGGPVALKQVLCALPASFPVPILIVQHMADGFLQGMAGWLSATCKVRVELAGHGTELKAGRAYVAPDGLHMRIGPQRQLAFEAGPPVHGHRPAVSCLFESVALHCGRHAIGILLSGMGRDGAAELKLMRDAGAITIAQDEASSVVHGMPGEAIRCDGAAYVMSPEEIGAALPALLNA